MKIVKIESFLLEKKLASPMRISRGGFKKRTHLIVQVTTDEGITGLGEGVGNAPLIKAVMDCQFAHSALGFDPFNIEILRHKLMDSHIYFERKGSALCAFSALEMACWDIKGKALNVPVYQLLGGLCRDTVEAYASNIYWEEDPKEMCRAAEDILKKGFRNMKAHVGCESPQKDLKRIAALRETAGRETKLMIDLNAGYDAPDALLAARLWEPLNLFWLEEPIDPNQIEKMSELRSCSEIPIASGENEFRVHGFKELFDQKAVDIAMPDIGRAGGLMETKNICNLAQVYGVPVSPHNFSSGILLAATLHLMASTPNTTLLEFDNSENAVYQELLMEPLKIKDGFVSIPSHPGLGVHLPREVLQKYGT